MGAIAAIASAQPEQKFGLIFNGHFSRLKISV